MTAILSRGKELIQGVMVEQHCLNCFTLYEYIYNKNNNVNIPRLMNNPG